MTTHPAETRAHCAYCGHPVPDGRTTERFGERFCSEPHAEEFVAGVRAARMDAAARAATAATHSDASPAASCAMPPAGQRTWGDSLKRAACWGAPLLLLLGMPLIWSGGWAAAGGSVLSVVALLACPLGMYFMMRGMMRMQRQDATPESGRGKETPHA